jgi:hypothetical protein
MAKKNVEDQPLTLESLEKVIEIVQDQAEKPKDVEMGWKNNGWLKN